MDARVVAEHNTANSCWVVIHGNVYDVTDYLREHPGGAALLLKCAGTDATSEYRKVHSLTTVQEVLPKAKHLGAVDANTVQHMPCITQMDKPATTAELDDKLESPISAARRHVALCVRLADFEPIARATITRQVFTYLASAADTEQSHHDNLAQWSKVTFVPRVLRDVSLSAFNLSASMFGQPCALPFFIAATGLVGLTHPDGERALATAAALRGIHFSPSTYSSVPHNEIATVHAATLQQKNCSSNSSLFFQLYVHSDREKTLRLIRSTRDAGYAALIVTVDTPCVGNRDEDRRLKIEEALEWENLQVNKESISTTSTESTATETVVAGGNSGQLLRSLTWADLVWIRQAWGPGRPIAIKGVQSAEDARLAADAGVDAIYLSNHGGRQLHSAPPCLATLLRIRQQFPGVMTKCEIFVDGGCLRGGDILKAVCLGAKAVGIGRPLLYALGAYGLDGVLKGIDILKHELETTMALLGVTSLDQLNGSYVNIARLAREIDGFDTCKPTEHSAKL